MSVNIIDLENLNKTQLNEFIQKILRRFYLKITKTLQVEFDIGIKIHIISEQDFNSKVQIKNKSLKAFCDKNGIYCLSYCSNFLDYIRLLKHEIIHSILLSQFNCQIDWIQEGCAVYFSKQINLIYRNLQITKALPISILKDEFIHNESLYFYSGVYIKYLYEKYHDVFFDLLNNKVDVVDFEEAAICFYLLTKQNN